METLKTCLGNNSLSVADLQKLITATGLTKTEITAQEKEIDAQKYAKLFIKYVELFTDRVERKHLEIVKINMVWL